MKPREVLAMCREKEVKAVDLRFTDFFGAWQRLTIRRIRSRRGRET